MFACGREVLSEVLETISGGEDDNRCAGEEQSGSHWAKALRERERDSV